MQATEDSQHLDKLIENPIEFVQDFYLEKSINTESKELDQNKVSGEAKFVSLADFNLIFV